MRIAITRTYQVTTLHDVKPHEDESKMNVALAIAADSAIDSVLPAIRKCSNVSDSFALPAIEVKIVSWPPKIDRTIRTKELPPLQESLRNLPPLEGKEVV